MRFDGNGQQTRDRVHASDAVASVVALGSPDSDVLTVDSARSASVDTPTPTLEEGLSESCDHCARRGAA